MCPDSMPTKDAHERSIEAEKAKAAKVIHRVILELQERTGMKVSRIYVHPWPSDHPLDIVMK